MTIDALVELVSSAWRERRADGSIVSAPAWHDLDAAGRVAAFELTLRSRRLEAALDPEGLSSTAQAVLARVRG